MHECGKKKWFTFLTLLPRSHQLKAISFVKSVCFFEFHVDIKTSLTVTVAAIVFLPIFFVFILTKRSRTFSIKKTLWDGFINMRGTSFRQLLLLLFFFFNSVATKVTETRSRDAISSFYFFIFISCPLVCNKFFWSLELLHNVENYSGFAIQLPFFFKIKIEWKSEEILN